MSSASFWFQNPGVLLDQNHISEIWPTPSMNFEEKLNAMTRMVILLSVLGSLVTMKISFLLIGLMTLLVIVAVYKLRKQQIISTMLHKPEGFDNNNQNRKVVIDNPVTLETVLRSDYYPSNAKNPFGNVLLTEIMDDPERKAAPPSFNVDVDEEILRSTKKAVQRLNPGIQSTNKKLFGDLADQYDLDQFMRLFYSTANTRVTNDQGAYGQFLYGNMPSSKESNAEAAMQRVKDNYRYILY